MRSKRCQCLHYCGPFGGTWASNATGTLHNLVIYCTFDISGIRATDAMEWEWQGVPWGTSLRRRDHSCMTSLTRLSSDSISSKTTLSGIPLPKLFTRSPTQQSSARVVWKLTSSLPSRNRSALIGTLNPSAIDGTTIKFRNLVGPSDYHAARPQQRKGFTKIWNKNGSLNMILSC